MPSQYATIQAAIVAAAPGDRVLVQPGTYHERLYFLGKGIEVIGVGGADVTIIDATGLRWSCVTFFNDEPPEAMLAGFTLTGGTGSNPGFGFDNGGGINIRSGARPVVRECVITGNTARSGGGVAASVLFSDVDAAHFIDCLIVDNEATVAGGGMDVTFTGTSSPEFGDTDGQPVFEGCIFADNEAGAAGGGSSGGGVFLDCLFVGNVSEAGGGAYNATLFERTIIRGNTATNIGGGYYGAAETTAALAGVTLIENTAELGGGAFLDPFEFPTDSDGGPLPGPKFASATGCVFARNISFVGGDGLYVFGAQEPTTTLTNCSFDGDAVVSTGGTLEVSNTIAWNVVGPFTQYSGTITVHHSDVQGGWPGLGNIAADPLWVDPAGGDYTLKGCSPCIDAGDPTAPLDPDGTPVEVGAVPYHTWKDLGGGVPARPAQALLAGTGLLLPATPLGVTLTGAAPSTPVWLIAVSPSSARPSRAARCGRRRPVIGGLPTNPAGSLALSATWPASHPLRLLAVPAGLVARRGRAARLRGQQRLARHDAVAVAALLDRRTLMLAAPWHLPLAAVVVLLLPRAARADDLQVPAQYPTIQLAIASASPGDTVLVQPGTYHESIDFLGKAIEVIGVGGAAVTAIDATGLFSSCVLFLEDEPPAAVLRGFTLTGGTGSNPGGGFSGGGGVFIHFGAHPTVRDCVITGTRAAPAAGSCCTRRRRTARWRRSPTASSRATRPRPRAAGPTWWSIAATNRRTGSPSSSPARSPATKLTREGAASPEAACS